MKKLKFIIGLEDGVFANVFINKPFCNQEMEWYVVDKDKHSIDPILVNGPMDEGDVEELTAKGLDFVNELLQKQKRKFAAEKRRCK